MSQSVKPKRALIAYCVLAERLRVPGIGILQALTPFFAEACQPFAGQLFDATKFSDAVSERYAIRIPRLAALGLAEQLAGEGLLEVVSGYARATVYQYPKAITLADVCAHSPVTEKEIEAVLASFVSYCRTDSRLDANDDASLEASFLDRLLNIDSMRLLSKREVSITAKRTPNTLGLKPHFDAAQPNTQELHLDFLVSQFLLDLQNKNPNAFDQVSNIAFANMAAEAIACFREPPKVGVSLAQLTIYLDSPLLLDMLGVNSEYEEYGRELLSAIKASGATPAVLDHCVAEAEAAIHAQLGYLRSGINKTATNWGTTARPDLLAALADSVGERASTRLGIVVQRDPEVNLHRRAPTTVGDIDAELDRRMHAWSKADAKDHDRKSIWAILALRDTSEPCPRICDSKWIFLTRNTALVSIANNAWATWLSGSTKFSQTHIQRWAPAALSDKQFAGYLWARTGGSDGVISRTRLLAYCSAAVRPRADVKARAINLVLELYGREQADDLAALLEDREGAKALMRATLADPEDVTELRLPFILERVKLGAGEFAAAAAREEAAHQLEQTQTAHSQELERLRDESKAAQATAASKVQYADDALVQSHQSRIQLEAKSEALGLALEKSNSEERQRQSRIFQEGFLAGVTTYKRWRWTSAILVGAVAGAASMLSTDMPLLSSTLSVVLGTGGFWFVPEFLDKPITARASSRMQKVIAYKDPTLELPMPVPDFKSGQWRSAVKNLAEPTTSAPI